MLAMAYAEDCAVISAGKMVALASPASIASLRPSKFDNKNHETPARTARRANQIRRSEKSQRQGHKPMMTNIVAAATPRTMATAINTVAPAPTADTENIASGSLRTAPEPQDDR